MDDPIFAIWSLGQPGLAASFFFDVTPTLMSGGPNSSFGGESIVVNGNTVSGNEGSGTVQFSGTFSSISWTNSFENFYAFTVGLAEVDDETPGNGVSEPGTVFLCAIGLAAVLPRIRSS